MLDLAAIYGQSNSDIVKDIISECYLNNGSYDNDTWQFLDIVENEYLYIFENQIDTCVDFRVQNKENSKMLEQLEMRTMTKALFSVK